MLLLAILLAGVIVTSADTSVNRTLREEFHHSYALAAHGKVTLENINGDVHVTAWDRDEVKVDAVKRAGSRQRLEDAQVVIETKPGAIAIKTRYIGQDDDSASVDYNLIVPRAAMLDQVKLVNGTLEIAGITGEVHASSVNGAIRTRNLTGDVRLDTVSGRLEAIFDELDAGQSISVNSVNGAIEVLLPLDAHAELRADTVSGGIRNDFALPMDGGRHLNGALKGGGTRIKVSNVNGSISVVPVWHGKKVKLT